ncbi:hypothetical protein CY34DRAFT_808332 [Suillus luteus UH-Slu-Lm8-n1]|uniref:Uncharacterized protein n=1 Tax=Suillus luteus UH-Slu-Lm8-n1 TaxID=930992 RepID=A0A0C9ZNZ3_9AGAM|nr:hypothetical protein CY34DRAFT_808332 [Suillus luteus UH-Slu-Lm8-n1]
MAEPVTGQSCNVEAGCRLQNTIARLTLMAQHPNYGPPMINSSSIDVGTIPASTFNSR